MSGCSDHLHLVRMPWIRLVASLLIGLIALSAPLRAHASVCDDPLALEAKAYVGGLSEDQVLCLESRMLAEDPETRAQISFMLIIQTYMTGDQADYGRRMRKHLTVYHTRDPEVAYLYITWLKQQGRFDEEMIKFAKVALEGRYRWTNNKSNYTAMVQSVYDMLNEASLTMAVMAKDRYAADASEQNRLVMQRSQRRARYWMIISAPCIYHGDCAPRFEVEVEGYATCNDLFELEDRGEHGQVSVDELACLRSKYRRPGSSKTRILKIMSDNADHDENGREWETLLSWHYNLTETDDPNLAAAYAEYLAKQGPEAARDAIMWAEIALGDPDALRWRGKTQHAELLQLRSAAASDLVSSGDAEARALSERFSDEQDAYCAENSRLCKRAAREASRSGTSDR